MNDSGYGDSPTSLVAVTIPSTLTDFGAYSFMGCTALTHINLISGLTVMGGLAFNMAFGPSSLKKVIIPSTIINFGGTAFGGCSSLSDVTLVNGLLLWADLLSECILRQQILRLS